MGADCEVKTKKNQGSVNGRKSRVRRLKTRYVYQKKHKCWYNRLIRISWKSLQIKVGREKVALYYL